MLREATDADLDDMRTWRNHPEVRRVSLTQHEIQPDEHRAWWEKTKNDPTRKVLIYERDDIPSGVVTFFDMEDGKSWWGYYLDNDGLEQRGAMFPAWMSIQREAIKYAKNELGLTQLDGETLAMNESAVGFNERMGFEEVQRYKREVGDETYEVIHTRKTFERK